MSLLIIFFFIKCIFCYINAPAQIHINKIIDYKKIYNIFNTFSIIEESILNNNAKDVLHTFAIFDEKFKYSNEGISQLLELSSKYNSNFCIIHNQCNLYDNFRLKIDYTLLYMENMYNCKIDTNRILDIDYMICGKFPYYCSLYQNGIYSKLKIITL
jgi:hypothetical protein